MAENSPEQDKDTKAQGTTGQWRQGAAIVAEEEPFPHSGTGDKSGLREGERANSKGEKPWPTNFTDHS